MLTVKRSRLYQSPLTANIGEDGVPMCMTFGVIADALEFGFFSVEHGTNRRLVSLGDGAFLDIDKRQVTKDVTGELSVSIRREEITHLLNVILEHFRIAGSRRSDIFVTGDPGVGKSFMLQIAYYVLIGTMVFKNTGESVDIRRNGDDFSVRIVYSDESFSPWCPVKIVHWPYELQPCVRQSTVSDAGENVTLSDGTVFKNTTYPCEIHTSTINGRRSKSSIVILDNKHKSCQQDPGKTGTLYVCVRNKPVNKKYGYSINVPPFSSEQMRLLIGNKSVIASEFNVTEEEVEEMRG